MANGNTRMFIKQLLANPVNTGAILPSSTELADKILEFAAPGPNAVIAEFGPGTGVFTQVVLESLRPGQTFFAIEVNEKFAAALRERFPDLHLYEQCASSVAECCEKEGVDHVDCVISGLPWANFSDELQEKILNRMVKILPEGGTFVTFAYLQGLVMPAGRKFKQHLKSLFSRVENSGVVWKNVPPAIIYRCIK